jgi:hypothetical protein
MRNLIYPESGILNQGRACPHRTYGHIWMYLGCHNLRVRGTVDIQWAETRHTAKCPPVHRTVPKTRIIQAQISIVQRGRNCLLGPWFSNLSKQQNAMEACETVAGRSHPRVAGSVGPGEAQVGISSRFPGGPVLDQGFKAQPLSPLSYDCELEGGEVLPTSPTHLAEDLASSKSLCRCHVSKPPSIVAWGYTVSPTMAWLCQQS